MPRYARARFALLYGSASACHAVEARYARALKCLFDKALCYADMRAIFSLRYALLACSCHRHAAARCCYVASRACYAPCQLLLAADTLRVNTGYAGFAAVMLLPLLTPVIAPCLPSLSVCRHAGERFSALSR